MTQTFWLAVGVMILLALSFLVAPLIFHRSGRQAALDLRNQNLMAYRSRLDELARELDAGTLDQESYDQLKDELAGSLLDDVPDADRGVLNAPSETKGGRSSLWVVLVSLVLIPVAVIALYDRWGAMDDLEQFRAMQEMASADGDRRSQMQNLAGQLRDKLEAQPDNPDGWAMLGRTYMNLEQYADAAEAFERLANSVEEDDNREAVAWGLSAQALFFLNQGQLEGGVSRAIERARALNPDEVNSLGLLGIAAFSSQQFEEALGYWERIVEVAPDHPQIVAIRQGIEQAYQRLGKQPPAELSDDQPAGPGIAVRVEIDPAFAEDIPDDTALFVFARSAGQSSGPPLAVARLTAGQLPAVIRLDDRNAMSPQARLSDAEAVRVQARLSRSGNALPQAGDWQGQLDEPINVGDAQAGPAATLVIDTQLRN